VERGVCGGVGRGDDVKVTSPRSKRLLQARRQAVCHVPSFAHCALMLRNLMRLSVVSISVNKNRKTHNYMAPNA
jgi:hypothetical protein